MTDVVMAYQIMNKRCLDWLTAPAQLVSVGRHDPAVLLVVEPRDVPHLPEHDAFYKGAPPHRLVQAAFDLSSAAAPRGVLLTRVSHTNADFPAPSFVSRLQPIRIVALWWLLAPRGG